MKWFATIATVTALICAGGPWAEAATTPVLLFNNIDDPVNHPYSQTMSNSCDSAYCSLDFPATTATETLVQHVSCNFELGSSQVAYVALLGDDTTGDVNYVNMTARADGSYSLVTINESTYLFVKSGDDLRFYVYYTGGIASPNVTCTISGYHN